MVVLDFFHQQYHADWAVESPRSPARPDIKEKHVPVSEKARIPGPATSKAKAVLLGIGITGGYHSWDGR